MSKPLAGYFVLSKLTGSQQYTLAYGKDNKLFMPYDDAVAWADTIRHKLGMEARVCEFTEVVGEETTSQSEAEGSDRNEVAPNPGA